MRKTEVRAMPSFPGTNNIRRGATITVAVTGEYRENPNFSGTWRRSVHCCNVRSTFSQVPSVFRDKSIPKDLPHKRYWQVILSFLGITAFGLQMASLGVGIVAMTDYKAVSSFPIQNYTLGQKGLMSGMIGYGNGIGNVLLGCYAHRWRLFKMLPVMSGLFSGTMACAVPVVAIYIGFEAVCVVVLLQGLGLSFVYPCVYAHLSNWVVAKEQGKFSWVWSGHQVGHLVMMTVTGLLHFSPGGWPSIFYLPGLFAIFWGIAFLIWSASSPLTHKSLSERERVFFEHNMPSNRYWSMEQQNTVPWKAILHSVPLWALLVVQVSDVWTSESLMGPVFLNSACHMTVRELGLTTAMAYFLNILAGVLCAFLAHRVTDRIGLNFSRKFWTGIGMYGGACSMGLLILFADRCQLAILFLELRIIINAATHPGYMSTMLNMAPTLAATIAATFNTITSFVASSGAVYTGMTVGNEFDLREWHTVFAIAIGASTIGCTIFIIFGSTDPLKFDAESRIQFPSPERDHLR